MDEHSALVVTASTGKAAINVYGTTLHYAFGLPVREGITFTQLAGIKKIIFKKMWIWKLSLLTRYHWFQNLLSLIWMWTCEKFNDHSFFNLDFSGKSMPVIGDFLQLPSSGWMIFDHLTPTDAWHLFKLHKLTEIVV